jgi:hypothetical protein
MASDNFVSGGGASPSERPGASLKLPVEVAEEAGAPQGLGVGA